MCIFAAELTQMCDVTPLVDDEYLVRVLVGGHPGDRLEDLDDWTENVIFISTLVFSFMFDLYKCTVCLQNHCNINVILMHVLKIFICVDMFWLFNIYKTVTLCLPQCKKVFLAFVLCISSIYLYHSRTSLWLGSRWRAGWVPAWREAGWGRAGGWGRWRTPGGLVGDGRYVHYICVSTLRRKTRICVLYDSIN